ncbi:MAG: sodium/solute symporter [Chitinophagaceae bacterium]
MQKRKSGVISKFLLITLCSASWLLAGCDRASNASAGISASKGEVSLALLDWLVIAAYLLSMLGIGFYYSRKNKNENDFFLGGGKMNPIALGLSLFASVTSSLSYIGWPGEIIKYGPVMFAGVISFPFIYFVVGWFLIPMFKKMNVTSAYEILEIKLGVSIRILATFFFLTLRFLWMATIIYVSVDIVILSLLHIDHSYGLVIGACLMLVTIVYTSLGGLKAVVLTDVVQAFILLGGAFITIIAVSIHFGSLVSWLPHSWLPQWGELKLGVDPQDRSAIGGAILMTFVWYVASSGSDQMTVQRFLASEDVKSARKTFGVSLVTGFIGMALLSLVGFAMIAYFTANPQYIAVGKTIATDADMLFPKFIVMGLPVGVSGLLVAGIIAAAMSSLSSGLNSTATVISEDIIKRFRKNDKKTVGNLNQARNLSLFVGVLTLLLSIAIPYVKGNLIDITIKVVNLFVSPLFVLFFMALFVPFATARGTFIGGIAATLIAIAVAFFGFLRIEVFFITIVSLFVGIVAGVVCSFVDHKIIGNQETAFNRV